MVVWPSVHTGRACRPSLLQSLLRSYLFLVARGIAETGNGPACLLQVQKQEVLKGQSISLAAQAPADMAYGIVVPQPEKPAIPADGPHVCVLARICGPESACAPGPGPPEEIVRAFLASIAAQTYRSWELHLLNGEGGGEVYQSIVQNIGDERIVNGPSAAERFATNTWGYDATNLALNDVLQQPSKNTCEYFLFTNADNIYGRKFLEMGVPAMDLGRDLIGSNFVTRYVQGEPGKPWTYKAMLPVHDAGFSEAHIDLGAVLVSAEAIRETGLRFTNLETADWKFFEAIMQRANGQGHIFIDELQYIHQL